LYCAFKNNAFKWHILIIIIDIKTNRRNMLKGTSTGAKFNEHLAPTKSQKLSEMLRIKDNQNKVSALNKLKT
jgi:hypothetical protein